MGFQKRLTVATWNGLEKQSDWLTVPHLPPHEHCEGRLVPGCSLGQVGLGQGTNSVSALRSKYGGYRLSSIHCSWDVLLFHKRSIRGRLCRWAVFVAMPLILGTLTVTFRAATTPRRSERCFGFSFLFTLTKRVNKEWTPVVRVTKLPFFQLIVAGLSTGTDVESRLPRTLTSIKSFSNFHYDI